MRFLFALVLLASSLDSFSLDAQCELTQLSASNAAQGDWFGVSVTGVADQIMVAGRDSEGLVPGTGAVYIFARLGFDWLEVQAIFADDGELDDQFGYSIAADGDYLLVGARLDDDGGTDAGAVYVFQRSGPLWNQTQKLTPTVPTAGAEFGYSVAIDGEVAVVGAASGGAFVFRRDGGTWLEEQQLGTEGGWSVAIDESAEVAVVGSPFDATNGVDAGAAFIYRFDGLQWQEEQMIVPPAITAGDEFGVAVAVTGDRALFGTWSYDTPVNNGGAVFAFEFDGATWNEEQSFTSSDVAAGDQFGRGISLDGDRILVSARRDDDLGLDSGSAYIFEFDGSTWTETTKLLASNGMGDDRFSRGGWLGGTIAAVGAIWHDAPETNAGQAYVFVIAGDDCNSNGEVDECEIFLGTSPDANGNGILDVCESVQFRRGDADGDGVFNGLVDGLFVLAFGFIPGSPAPPCEDAADADDDGIVSGLIDGVAILNFQFVPGAPPPADPGPGTCGLDPSADTLTCMPAGCP